MRTGRLTAPYRQIFAVRGSRWFCLCGMVGRLPIAIVTLGIVLGITRDHGSYALAGSVAAAFVVAEACVAVLHGRVLDSLGQARWLPVAGTAFAGSMTLLVLSIALGWPPPVPHLFAAAAGMSLPPVGACVRARWAHVLASPDDRRTAYSLESVVDESVFMLGPTAVTLLATLWFPLAGLVIGVSVSVVAMLALAAQRRTQPPTRHRDRTTDGAAPLRVSLFAPLVVACIAAGGLFGGVEVTTVAFAAARHHAASAGPLLAVWALGSLLAGLVNGTVASSVSATRRVQVGLLAMALLTAPFALAGSAWALAGVMLLGGVAVAPTLASLYELAEAAAPRGRVTEAITVMQTGFSIGIALGSPVIGALIDHAGPSVAFGGCAGFGLAAWAVSLALPADRSPAPREPVGV